MEGQRQKSGGSRRRRPRPSPRTSTEPVLIAARRPDSPLMGRVASPNLAASAQPKPNGAQHHDDADSSKVKSRIALVPETPKRVVRIVQAAGGRKDDVEQMRQRLLMRLVHSEGRHAISKVADELWANNFEAPHEQEVQLQLLEHFDEAKVRNAIEVLAGLLSKQPVVKRPILEQRLRRLEEYADEDQTRTLAGSLRRALRG